MKYTRYAFVDFRNGGTQLFQFESDKKITNAKIVSYLKKHYDWDEERDSLTIEDDATTVKL